MSQLYNSLFTLHAASPNVNIMFKHCTFVTAKD